MTFFTWILVGILSGFVASRMAHRSGEGTLLEMLLGAVGGVVAGWLLVLFGPEVSGLDGYNVTAALVGAVVLLVVYHLTRGDTRFQNHSH